MVYGSLGGGVFSLGSVIWILIQTHIDFHSTMVLAPRPTIQFWHEDIIYGIARVVGEPIAMDNAKRAKSRMLYCKVSV